MLGDPPVLAAGLLGPPALLAQALHHLLLAHLFPTHSSVSHTHTHINSSGMLQPTAVGKHKLINQPIGSAIPPPCSPASHSSVSHTHAALRLLATLLGVHHLLLAHLPPTYSSVSHTHAAVGKHKVINKPIGSAPPPPYSPASCTAE